MADLPDYIHKEPASALRCGSSPTLNFFITSSTMASYQHIRLASKPTAQISYGFHRPVSAPSTMLVVYLNGMGLPQASWAASITKLQEIRQGSTTPALLTYDRFGQGQTTDRDPQDEGASDPTHGHDCLSAVKDLQQLITQVASEKLGAAEVNSLSPCAGRKFHRLPTRPSVCARVS